MYMPTSAVRAPLHRAALVVAICAGFLVLFGDFRTRTGTEAEIANSAAAAVIPPAVDGLAHGPLAQGKRAAALASTTPTPMATSTPVCEFTGTVEQTPQQPSEDTLQGIEVLSAADIWAVGYKSGATGSETLIVHWDGSAWSIIPSPNASPVQNVLRSVRAASSEDIWAVGYYTDDYNRNYTLIENWNGSAWVIVDSPNIGSSSNRLHDIDLVAQNDVWAVGFYETGTGDKTLAVHWNGIQWAIVNTPNNAFGHGILYSVAALNANDVWAVGIGEDTEGLSIHWDGNAWETVPVPTVGDYITQLRAVAAGGPGDVWAVGYYRNSTTDNRTLMLRLTESGWEVIPSPNVDQTSHFLLDVTVAPTGVWATGSYGRTGSTLAIHDGRIVPSPNVGSSNNTLNAIRALGSTAWAVGSGSWTQFDLLVIKFEGQCGPLPSPGPTYTPTNTRTATPTRTATATPTVCPLQFTDVAPDNTFYHPVRCLACKGVISGYSNGTFRPDNLVTRGQIAKIVSNAAGFNEPVSGQTFEDVPPDSTFYVYIERLMTRPIVSGYDCGGPNEPCVPPEYRPYFRPNAGTTRGQLAKMVSNAAGFADIIPVEIQTFEDVTLGNPFRLFVERLLLNRPGVMSGYACGGSGEPCVPPENRPYFRPGNPLTRGQTSKIVANTFFPGCQPRSR